jgi:hypothetical protein
MSAVRLVERAFLAKNTKLIVLFWHYNFCVDAILNASSFSDSLCIGVFISLQNIGVQLTFLVKPIWISQFLWSWHCKSNSLLLPRTKLDAKKQSFLVVHEAIR